MLCSKNGKKKRLILSGLQIEGYMYVNSQNRMRMRIYNVLDDVKRNHAFEPVVVAPSDSPDFKPRVDWLRFHSTRYVQHSL